MSARPMAAKRPGASSASADPPEEAEEPTRAAQSLPDFQRLFESAPGSYLVLDPGLRIIAVNGAHADASRVEMVGRRIFEVFPGELREAQRLAHIGIWHWDSQTDATSGSDEFFRIYGLDPATQRIPAFRDQKGVLYPVATWERLNAAIQQAMQTGAGFELDLTALRNGARIWVTTRGETVRDARGRVVGLRGTVQDISERKRIEEALRASELREHDRTAELAALLEAVPIPVFIAHDPDCLHMTGNHAADDLLRNPRGAEASLSAAAETRPQHFKVFRDGRELKSDELPAQQAARGIPTQNVELDLVFDDGTTRHVLAYATPLWDVNRRPRGSVLVLVDITERRQLQEALQAREAQLRSFVKQAPVAMALFDCSMKYLAASERWTEDYGRGSRDLAGLSIYAVHPDLPARWKEIHQRGLAGECLACESDRWLQANGSEIWLRWAVRPWLDPQGSIGGIIIMVEDISARKAAEEAVRTSEERLRLVLQATEVGTFEIELTTGETHWNSVEFELLGLKPGDVPPSAEAFFRYVHPADIPSLRSKWENATRTGQLDAEFRVLRADGIERWLAGKGRFVHKGEHANPLDAATDGIRPSRFLGVNFDISERKRLEHEVLEISAREQRRIGRDLHDDLCQWLAGTEMLCSGLAKRVEAESPANSARALQIAESLRQALARARMLAHGLEPSVIQSEGLVGALRELAMNASEMFHIRCQYEGPEGVHVRDEVAALHLYRIAQEAIGNAVRHGRARDVRILLQVERERVAMIIRDDGSGIAQTSAPTLGMGLRNMRYRAGIIGGTLEIRPAVTGGTEIVCVFPGVR